ncbi:hypothetical protein TNCV_3886251 [Trichonephila clavipes]|nr:hypothetical protein TNCV_3886251 [Trichonephila clavipes]
METQSPLMRNGDTSFGNTSNHGSVGEFPVLISIERRPYGLSNPRAIGGGPRTFDLQSNDEDKLELAASLQSTTSLQ